MSVKEQVKKILPIMNFRMLLSAYRAPLPEIIRNKEEIRKFKDKHKGERCFVIGNGPSLKADDLTKIKNAYSFAANYIYKIFAQTPWRPTYYCVQDENVLREMPPEDLKGISDDFETMFFRLHSCHLLKENALNFANSCLVPIWNKKEKNNSIPFSAKADKVLFDGSTVTFMALQLAVYMGFKEIYLLGCDHQMPYQWTEDNNVIINDLNLASHFYDGAENNVDKDGNLEED